MEWVFAVSLAALFTAYRRRALRHGSSVLVGALLIVWPCGSSAAPADTAESCPALNFARQTLASSSQLRQQFQLDNGLRVVLLPDPEAVTAAIVTTVAVGARDEPDGETGYAHLFEHLMFRGSATLPDGAFSQLLDSVGGSHNAETHYDYTSYYLSVPAEALELMLWQEAQRFLAPALSEEIVRSEIASVHEEMALRVDNVPFVRSGSELLFEQLQGSDYDHLILGSSTDLHAATPARLQAFYQRHYRPERTVLVVAGRFDVTAIRQQIQHDWSAWQNLGEAAPVASSLLPPAQSLDAQLVDNRSPWPALAFVWQTVPTDHPDATAVALVQQWMFRGEQARLRQLLLEKNLLLHSAEFPLTMPRLGLVHFIAVPRASASLTRIEQQVDAMLRDAASNPPDANQLCELKTAVLRRLVALSELPRGIAHRESIDLALWQRPLLQEEIRALEQVSTADLHRVLEQYFLPQRLTLRLLPPWYMRWTKRLLEWLPSSWSDALEAKML